MFSCNKLKELFKDCVKPVTIVPNSLNQDLINEAKKYNCILLSKELYKQCKNMNDEKEKEFS